MNEREEHGWVANGKSAPPIDSDAYLWWRRGLVDEHFAEIDGYSEGNLALRDTLDSLAKIRRGITNEEIVRMLAQIWIPGELCQHTEVPPTATPEEVVTTAPPGEPGS